MCTDEDNIIFDKNVSPKKQKLYQGDNVWKTEKGLFLSCSSVLQCYPSMNIEIEIITLKELEPVLYTELSYSVKSSDKINNTQLCYNKKCCNDDGNKANQPDHLSEADIDHQSEAFVNTADKSVILCDVNVDINSKIDLIIDAQEMKKALYAHTNSVILCDVNVDINSKIDLIIDAQEMKNAMYTHKTSVVLCGIKVNQNNELDLLKDVCCDENSFNYNTCNKEFTEKKRLNVNSLEYKSILSLSCNNGYKNLKRIYHNNKKKFIRDYTLRKKKNILLHNSKKPFVCNMCKTRFTRLSSFKRHHFLHTGIKPYRTPFTRLLAWKKHI